MKGISVETHDPMTLPVEIDAQAFIDGLGEKDAGTVKQGIIVLPEGTQGKKPAKFIANGKI